MKEVLSYPLSKQLVDEIFKTTNSLLLKDNSLGKTTKNKIKHQVKPVFANYVTRNEEFKNELIALKGVVTDYANRIKVKRPLNILLAAEPGTGKSFLIKQLAKSIEDSNSHQVEFSEFHTPAFQGINDLHDVFHRVQSANLHGKIPFVFFDEVDGLVDGRSILPNFLAPMWEGVFHTGKNSYALGKAIFVFAGSTLLPSPSIKIVLGGKRGTRLKKISYNQFAEAWRNLAHKNLTAQNLPVKEKQKDFLDRIDVLICIPPVDEILLGTQISEELIDISCLLVKKNFEKIETIELSVISVITKFLSGSASRRPAEKMIFCSHVPNDSKVFTFEMLPPSIIQKYGNMDDIKSMMKTFYQIEIIN